MKIGPDTVVSLDFTLRDDDGDVIDSSEGEPLSYLHGHGELVPGLERALLGRTVGDALKITLEPDEGYGEITSDLFVTIDRGDLPPDLTPELGMELSCDGPDGEVVNMWIVEVAGDEIRLDGNHPLAGQTLHFEVDVRAVRAATEEEVEHGHVHGADDTDPIAPGTYTH